MASQTEQLKELKKIAKLRFDKERHRLAAINDEMAQLEAQRKKLRQQIVDLKDAQEASPAALINAYAYLDALSHKADQLDADRQAASERTKAQRERIKTALASKIRIDSMGDD